MLSLVTADRQKNSLNLFVPALIVPFPDGYSSNRSGSGCDGSLGCCGLFVGSTVCIFQRDLRLCDVRPVFWAALMTGALSSEPLCS